MKSTAEVKRVSVADLRKDPEWTWERINEAIAQGQGTFDCGFEYHRITEYTHDGLITFAENGFQSPRRFGTGRIYIDVE